MRVIFEPLPKESFYIYLCRKILRIKRTAENVVVGLNGKVLVIKRGVSVVVPSWVPDIALQAPYSMRYNCYILNESKKILSDSEITSRFRLQFLSAGSKEWVEKDACLNSIRKAIIGEEGKHLCMK